MEACREIRYCRRVETKTENFLRLARYAVKRATLSMQINMSLEARCLHMSAKFATKINSRQLRQLYKSHNITHTKLR